MGIYIWYQYVRFSSQEIVTKWGTFVEGIFETTSFLPYLQNDFSSNFYQWLLFNSCLIYKEDGSTQNDICSIQTSDNKKYEISLAKGMIRSDGTPVSLEDVFFTYDKIIRQNHRNIKFLDSYKSIKIEKEGSSITLTFPTASVDNKAFFTNYILPEHILKEATIQEYITNFSMEPVYTNCANIVSQTTDQYSLIFNLINCKDTNLNFYQIKNLQTFSTFQTSVQDGKGSIVDAYINKENLDWYVEKQLLTNKLITFFFNTQSPQMRVRTRRALWWFIKSNFYTGEYQKYLAKYNEPLFSQFISDGENVQDFLKRNYGTENTIAKEDLIDIGIWALPTTVTMTNEEPKLAYYLENFDGTTGIQVTLDKEYTKAYVEYNWKNYYDSSFKSKSKILKYDIGESENNFSSWLNKYKIYGVDSKGIKDFVGSIDVYNIKTTSAETDEEPVEKIKIVYYNDELYNFIVEHLKTIFFEKNILKYFDFVQVNSAEELESKITMWEYDIVINVIDMGIKKDLTNLFITDNAKVNPSQYQSQNIANRLTQYVNSDSESTKSKLAKQINDTYSTDMPLLFLGKVFIPISFKENIYDKVFWSGKMELYEHNRRDIIYEQIHLVNNINIDWQKVWDKNNFSDFLNQTFNLQKKTEIDSNL